VALAMVVASRATNVIDISVFMLGLSSAELTANWAQWWWWRFNGKARLAASFGGPALFLFNQYVVFRYFVDAGPASAYLVVFASMAATSVLWIVVALVTNPEPEEQLLEFYRRARPLGAWGPIARKAGLPAGGWTPLYRGFGIAAIGAAMVGTGIVALSCAYVGQWNVAAVAILLAVGTGVAFRMWFGPFVEALWR
jgi:hypothetical protein